MGVSFTCDVFMSQEFGVRLAKVGYFGEALWAVLCQSNASLLPDAVLGLLGEFEFTELWTDAVDPDELRHWVTIVNSQLGAQPAASEAEAHVTDERGDLSAVVTTTVPVSAVVPDAASALPSSPPLPSLDLLKQLDRAALIQ